MDTRNDDDNRELLGEREEGFSVRDLADIAQTTVRTIHYYIAEGLLPPPRGSKRQASYSDAHLARLRLIAALRDEGLALAAIRTRLAPLTDEQALAVVETLDEHLAAGDRSITLLGLLEAALTREVNPEVFERYESDERDAGLERRTGIQEEAMHPTNMPSARRAFQPLPPPAPASAAQPMSASFDSTPGTTLEAPADSASDYLGRLLRRPASKRPGPSRPAPLPRPPQPRPQPLPDPYASLRPETWHHFEIADGVELRVRDDRYRQERGQLRAVIDSLRPILQRYGLTHEPPDDDR